MFVNNKYKLYCCVYPIMLICFVLYVHTYTVHICMHVLYKIQTITTDYLTSSTYIKFNLSVGKPVVQTFFFYLYKTATTQVLI